MDSSLALCQISQESIDRLGNIIMKTVRLAIWSIKNAINQMFFIYYFIFPMKRLVELKKL